MKASVSHHTVSAFGLIGSLLILWAVLVIPGAPWMGFVTLAALAVVVTSATVLCLGRIAPTAVTLARVITKGRH